MQPTTYSEWLASLDFAEQQVEAGRAVMRNAKRVTANLLAGGLPTRLAFPRLALHPDAEWVIHVPGVVRAALAISGYEPDVLRWSVTYVEPLHFDGTVPFDENFTLPEPVLTAIAKYHGTYVDHTGCPVTDPSFAGGAT